MQLKVYACVSVTDASVMVDVNNSVCVSVGEGESPSSSQGSGGEVGDAADEALRE